MNTTAIACLASAAIAAAGAWAYQGYRYDAQLAELQLSYSKRDFTALEAQYAETLRYQQQADTAARNAAQRVRAAHADAAVLRGTLDGLRGDLANGATRYATATEQARADYTATLGAVLSDCAGMAGEIAGKADGHVIDLLRLDEQWPPQ